MCGSPALNRSAWVQWVCLNMLCFGFGGTALGLIASPDWLWILGIAIVVLHWLVLRPAFRNTDDFFGFHALIAGWVFGAILLLGIAAAIEPQRSSNWLALLVVVLIVAAIFGLLLYGQWCCCEHSSKRYNHLAPHAPTEEPWPRISPLLFPDRCVVRLALGVVKWRVPDLGATR